MPCDVQGQVSSPAGEHVAGWAWVTSYLQELQGEGPYLETFVERRFVWSRNADMTGPLLRPWVGIFHVPENVPPWCDQEQRFSRLRKRSAFQASLPWLQHAITLSEHHARELREQLACPVTCVRHPTPLDVLHWSSEAYFERPEVVQVGSWLRRASSICKVQTEHPVCVLGIRQPWELQGLLAELRLERREDAFWRGVEQQKIQLVRRHIPVSEYEAKYRSACVFIDFHDVSASNAVLEGVARRTPMLLSRAPALVEYLGPGYPFFFDSLEDASRKLQDVGRLVATHQYLQALDLEPFTVGRFLREIREAGE